MKTPNYIRRGAEIMLALYVDYVYQTHKSTRDVVEFFRYYSIIMNVPDFEFVEGCILRWKDLMPTVEEVVLLSDLAPSRQGFAMSPIIQNKICRANFYRAYKHLDRTMTLEPKLLTRASDAIVNYIKNFQQFAIAFGGIKINGFDYD